jgi:signal transduction histidine kinase
MAQAMARTRDHGIWLFVLLGLIVLVPAACLVWFMNQAVEAQSAAARQSVLDAYRGQLRLVRGRIDAHWKVEAARLTHTDKPEQDFASLVSDGIADGIVLLDADGGIAYPQPASSRVLPPSREALRRASPEPGGGGNPEPRVPDPAAFAQSAPASLAEAGRRRESRSIDARAAALNDYSVSMPSSARLLRMTRLREIAPNVSMPTEAALRLSTEVVDAGPLPRGTGGFRPTAVPDVWALASDDRRVVGLYRTGRLEAMMHDALHEVAPEGITFIAFPPGIPADAEAIAAGNGLPGWRISFFPIDTRIIDAAARGRKTFLIGAGAAGIAIVALLGLGAGGVFRRQLHLARLKTDMVAAVSHELRTPLASMRVLVDGLMSDETLDPIKTREYLALIGAENARLSRLIENFLTFSRLERQRHQFVFAPVPPAAIAAAAIAATRDRMPAGCDLRQDIAPDLPMVRADSDALGTALLNLLDNALKYTPARKRIGVRVFRDNGMVVFAVEDNGIGIPAREHRRIFRRYYRVDPRLSGETSGVGLGLSIVDFIVRAHGGTVGVRSESGSGSTFTIRLPCEGAGARGQADDAAA